MYLSCLVLSCHTVLLLNEICISIRGIAQDAETYLILVMDMSHSHDMFSLTSWTIFLSTYFYRTVRLWNTLTCVI